MLEGAPLSGDQVDELAKLPPVDILRGQFLAIVVAPLTQLAALLAAPIRDLVGLIDARIEQLGGAEPEPEATPVDDHGRQAGRGAEGRGRARSPSRPSRRGKPTARPRRIRGGAGGGTASGSRDDDKEEE